MISTIKRIWNWLYAKRSEVAQMNYRDAFMAHVVFEILQPGTPHAFEFVPLDKLLRIHPVDNRENTRDATARRIKQVEEHADSLRKKKRLSKDDIAQVLPSATYMRAVPGDGGVFYAFEGNGRVAALKASLHTSDRIEVEIDVFRPKKFTRTIKKIEKLRRMHGMTRENDGDGLGDVE